MIKMVLFDCNSFFQGIGPEDSWPEAVNCTTSNMGLSSSNSSKYTGGGGGESVPFGGVASIMSGFIDSNAFSFAFIKGVFSGTTASEVTFAGVGMPSAMAGTFTYL